MKIAIFISGRLVRYEVCLIPFLLKISIIHDIDLFISINDTYSEYYDNAKKKLSTYLKGLYVNKYLLPDNFNHNPTKMYRYQLIDGQYVPLNILSMFYNDYKALSMIYNYSCENNVKYDIIMKYRSDIINNEVPDFNNFNSEILYSVIPECNMIGFGKHKVQIVCDQWVWGSYNIMKIYCNTYNYILEKLKEFNGYYEIHAECCLTDNCIDNNLEIIYISSIKYYLDKYRHIYDTTDNYNLNDDILGITKNIPIDVSELNTQSFTLSLDSSLNSTPQ